MKVGTTMNWLINIALNISLNLPLFFFTLTFRGNTLWICSLLVSCTTPSSRASSTDFVIKSVWCKQFFEFFCSLGGGGVESFHCILYPCWITDRMKESFVVLRHILIWDFSLPGMNGRGPSCFDSFAFERCWPRGSLLAFKKLTSVLRKKCNHLNSLEKRNKAPWGAWSAWWRSSQEHVSSVSKENFKVHDSAHVESMSALSLKEKTRPLGMLEARGSAVL